MVIGKIKWILINFIRDVGRRKPKPAATVVFFFVSNIFPGYLKERNSGTSGKKTGVRSSELLLLLLLPAKRDLILSFTLYSSYSKIGNTSSIFDFSAYGEISSNVERPPVTFHLRRTCHCSKDYLKGTRYVSKE